MVGAYLARGDGDAPLSGHRAVERGRVMAKVAAGVDQRLRIRASPGAAYARMAETAAPERRAKESASDGTLLHMVPIG